MSSWTLVALVALVALVTGGPLGSRVAERISASRLYAPDHLGVEVDSAPRGLDAKGLLTPEQAHAAREQAHAARVAALDVPIDLWPWALLSTRAWELRHSLSTDDAGYVALAEEIGATLVTLDRRVARAPGVRCPVQVVPDCVK